MRESYRKGVANHPDPESCGVDRKGGAEALTGARAGEVLSREIKQTLGADAVADRGRQHQGGRYRESLLGSARSETLCMHGNSACGNWEIPWFSTDGTVERVGKVNRPHVGDARPWEVGQPHSSGEAPEQRLGCASACGESRAKGADQGESAAAKQVPDTEPGRDRIWTTLNGHEAGNRGHSQGTAPTFTPPTCNVRRSGYGGLPVVVERRCQRLIRSTSTSACASLPEVGARCASSARRDLCGGPRVTGVPTATKSPGAMICPRGSVHPA